MIDAKPAEPATVAGSETAHDLQVSSPVLNIRLLGGFEVISNGRCIDESDWKLRKAAILIKLLALSHGYRLHREQIMDTLWPDLSPDAAANNMRYTLHVARRTLSRYGDTLSYPRFHGEYLWLAPEGVVQVDVDTFEAAASAARITKDPAAFRAAAALYMGDLLPDDRYDEWAAERREMLRATYLDLLLEVAKSHDAAGEIDSAIEALTTIAEREPVHEEARTRLMRLYALSGRKQQAIREYERLRHALSTELDAEPDDETERLYRQILENRFQPVSPQRDSSRPPTAPSASPGNLTTPLTSFIGREREMAEVTDLLRKTHLLTLTGFGGSGKTRLAIAVAMDQAGQYRDGAWIVSLGALSDPALVSNTVASTLQVHQASNRSSTETLIGYLRSRQILLVLDNCEHLIDACAEIVEALLSNCPELRIIATSREALSAGGEMVWRVPPLRLPNPNRLESVELLMQLESIRLFIERANVRRPDFMLTLRNAPYIVEICRRLDGLPLPIELAAGRTSVLTVEQIAGRLDDALSLLAGGGRTALPRQQTIRATLDWSYNLLSNGEQWLLRCLSVFSNGWTLAAVEAVCGSRDVLTLLAQLVDKSLVQVEAGNRESRYRLLETVRQYAAERLEQRGERHDLRKKHAAYYMELAERAEESLTGTDQAEWLERLESEHDNLRTALASSLECEPEMGVRMASALWRFWWVRGYQGEGQRWLDDALSRSFEVQPRLRAKLLRAAGNLAWSRGDHERARSLHEEGLSLYEQVDDKEGAALALNSLGNVALDSGDSAGAYELFERCLALWRELDNSRGIALALNNLGEVAYDLGRYDRALELEQESLPLFKKAGDMWGMALALENMGRLAQHLGDLPRAAELTKQSLELFRQVGYKRGFAYCLEILAEAAGEQGEHRRAARLFGAAEALREAISAPVAPAERQGYDRAVARTQKSLGTGDFTAAWAEGRAMQPNHAIDYAVSSNTSLSSASKAQERFGASQPLTPRELEVADLLARGLTIPAIAAELITSEQTIRTDIEHLLAKLGLTSRLQIAAWARERNR